MSQAWNMTKMRNGGHLEFLKSLQGDSRGLLVCYSWHFSEHILKVSACYYFVPGSTQLWANAPGLISGHQVLVIISEMADTMKSLYICTTLFLDRTSGRQSELLMQKYPPR